MAKIKKVFRSNPAMAKSGFKFAGQKPVKKQQQQQQQPPKPKSRIISGAEEAAKNGFLPG